MLQIRGCVALVTGSNRGLGRVFARVYFEGALQEFTLQRGTLRRSA
jgi:NAD(P)-dependent dehydrogenase (short-subunit alcohol dehydrogenase family)